MRANIRHVAFVGAFVGIIAIVISGAVVANVGADRQRPSLSLVSAPPVDVVGQPSPGNVDAAPSAVSSSEEPAASDHTANHSAPVLVGGLDPTPIDPGGLKMTDGPSASVEQVWAGTIHADLQEIRAEADPSEQSAEEEATVVNTDSTAQQAVPKAASTAEPETVEVEHTVSRIPDPPDVGASHKREKFAVQPEAHDPWQAVRRCESHNNYQINTGNGFYGAYQFTRSTWDWVAGKLGRQDLVGVRPDLASPADQDRLADALAFEVPGGGLHHWPVCGRLYG